MCGLHRKLQQKATKVKVKLENPTITLRHSSVIIQMMLKVDNVLSFQTELVENVKRTLNCFWLVRMLACLQFTSGEKIRSLNITSLVF